MFNDFITKYTDIFVEQNEREAFQIFPTKILANFRYQRLTNDVVIFEQPGPGFNEKLVTKMMNVSGRVGVRQHFLSRAYSATVRNIFMVLSRIIEPVNVECHMQA